MDYWPHTGMRRIYEYNSGCKSFPAACQGGFQIVIVTATAGRGPAVPQLCPPLAAAPRRPEDTGCDDARFRDGGLRFGEVMCLACRGKGIPSSITYSAGAYALQATTHQDTRGRQSRTQTCACLAPKARPLQSRNLIDIC